MSTNKTEYLQLHQWESGDTFSRPEFNDNFKKVDAAVNALTAAMPRMAVGSYVGTGAYGAGSPNTLKFDFAPKIIVIVSDFERIAVPIGIMIADQTQAGKMGTVSWDGNRVSWYATTGMESQMNVTSQTYHYFVIG